MYVSFEGSFAMITCTSIFDWSFFLYTLTLSNIDCFCLVSSKSASLQGFGQFSETIDVMIESITPLPVIKAKMPNKMNLQYTLQIKAPFTVFYVICKLWRSWDSSPVTCYNHICLLSAIRYEELFYTKLDKKRRERMTDVDTLGQDMMDAGNQFGPGTSYGKSLSRVPTFLHTLGNFENLEIFCHSDLQTWKKPWIWKKKDPKTFNFTSIHWLGNQLFVFPVQMLTLFVNILTTDL